MPEPTAIRLKVERQTGDYSRLGFLIFENSPCVSVGFFKVTSYFVVTAREGESRAALIKAAYAERDDALAAKKMFEKLHPEWRFKVTERLIESAQ